MTKIDSSAFLGCAQLTQVAIDSSYAYTNATSASKVGYLLNYATTVKVRASIIDGGAENAYLNNPTNYTRSEAVIDGYYVFTKIGA